MPSQCSPKFLPRVVSPALTHSDPSILTIDHAGTDARRAASMQGNPTITGLDRDEYPPAMFKEGGSGASVRSINRVQNRGAGACIGNACRGLDDGAQIEIIVVP
ncbi:MAG: NucA/NucB deoxyribonuclease domain-containing protein [Anaerolineae bacterium]